MTESRVITEELINAFCAALIASAPRHKPFFEAARRDALAKLRKEQSE